MYWIIDKLLASKQLKKMTHPVAVECQYFLRVGLYVFCLAHAGRLVGPILGSLVWTPTVSVNS